MTTYYADVSVNGMNLEIAIDYRVTPRIAATYLDPPEGGEIELEDVYCMGVTGETYEKERTDLGDWAPFLDNLAWSLVDDCDFIYDHQYEMEELWNYV